MSKWISVKEKLPEPFAEVFIWPRPEFHDVCFTGLYDGGKKRWEVDFYSGHEFEFFYPQVTHWMPLPEPPEDA